MDIEKVVAHYGGIQRTAKALGKSKQRVYNWVKFKKIPLIYQFHIEHVSGAKFVADTSHLPFELKII